MAAAAAGGKSFAEGITVFGASLVVFFLGVSIRGDWVFIFVNLWRHFYHNETAESLPAEVKQGFPVFREYLRNLHHYVIPSILVSYVTFFGMAGYFHRYFYVMRKDRQEEWKCQPGKFLTQANQHHAFIVGSVNMTIGAIYSGTVACLVMNGVPTKLYFNISDYGVIYTILSAILVFLFIDGCGYYAHKMYHIPYLYRNIHKWHHRYQQPMVWVAAAMHPVEFLTYQTIFVSPVFLIPVHPFVFLTVILYNYYYGVIDHSGIKMAAVWPWQPHSMYHDYHHKYYHCNFGFNTKVFDLLHGTIHRKDRIYGEDIFGGQGAPKNSYMRYYGKT